MDNYNVAQDLGTLCPLVAQLYAMDDYAVAEKMANWLMATMPKV